MNKSLAIRLCGILFPLPLILFLFISFRNNMTFIEHKQIENSAGWITEGPGVFYKDFKMPYTVFMGISFSLEDKNKTFEASVVSGDKLIQTNRRNEPYRQTDISFEAKKTAAVTINAASRIFIKVKDYNEKYLPETVNIYGGDFNPRFWISFTLLFGTVLMILSIRIAKLLINKTPVLSDTVTQGLLLLFACFTILLFYLNRYPFIDEFDNFQAGLILARGKILYKEYVTQHPPATMFLAALYTLLGAVSVEQMRLMYYLTMSVVFAGLYIRHKKHFGALIGLLFLFYITVVQYIFFLSSNMLGDSVSAVSMLVLLLEYLQYHEDKGLYLSRTIIISLSIFMGIGSTFLNIYPVSFLFFMFCLDEFKNRHNPLIKSKPLLFRYGRFIFFVLLPFGLTLFYFKINHGYTEFIRQVYHFNREVYSNYTGIGKSLLYPISESFKYFLNMLNVFSLNTIKSKFFYFPFTFLFLLSTIYWVTSKKIFYAGIFFFVILFLTRGYDNFHSIQYWILIFTVEAITLGDLFNRQRFLKLFKYKRQIMNAMCIIIAAGMLFASLNGLFLKPQKMVSDQNLELINMTKPGDFLFLESENLENVNTLYISYRNRIPVNRVPYMFPWYMEWYEKWCLEDLDRVSIAAWNPNSEVWGYTNFQPRFKEKIETEFTPIGNNLWIRK